MITEGLFLGELLHHFNNTTLLCITMQIAKVKMDEEEAHDEKHKQLSPLALK